MLLGEPKPEVSVVVENYLQAIYKLGEERGERIAPTRLAEAMGVSVPTAVGTLKRLTKQGLATVSASKEVTLTPKGLEMGETVVRRHRLAERMLTELIGLEWYRAHAEAHRFEHAISPHVEEKLANALGYPQTNPYGRPIPGYSDGLENLPIKPLSEVNAGTSTVVERLPEEDLRLLQFFQEIGLKPGTEITVVESAVYKGTVTLAMGDDHAVLGMEVARAILVRA